MNRDVVGFFFSIGLLFLGYLGINYYYAANSPNKVTQTSAPTAAPQTGTTAPAPSTPDVPSPVPAVAPAPGTVAEAVPNVSPVLNPPPASVEDLKIDLPLLEANFVQAGGCLGSVRLKRFHASVDKAEPVALHLKYDLCKVFGARIGTNDLRNTPALIERPNPSSIRMTQQVENIELVKTLTLNSDNYAGTLDVQIKNVDNKDRNAVVGIELGATSEEKSTGNFVTGYKQEFQEVVYATYDDVKRQALPFEESPTRETIESLQGIPFQWVSTGSLYFVTALLPKIVEPMNLTVVRTGFNIQRDASSPADRTVYEAWLENSFQLSPGSSKTWQYDVYLGPKVKDTLDVFEKQNLSRVIDYGFFKIVAWPIFHALKFINRFIGNWGFAIIVLTVLIKLLFYPLTVKAYVSGKKMQKVQPQMNAIREKYKDDRQKQSQEMMALMAQSGANPMSGCLPILPQIPVFFALFTVLQHSFELRHAPFVLWIKDLSAMDPYYILPVLLAILYYVQTALSPMPTMDPAQAKMMKFLPIIFALFMFSFPSGLVLYSLANIAMTILQQQYMMRKYKDA